MAGYQRLTPLNPPGCCRFRCSAMGTFFEVFFAGCSRREAAGGAEAAFELLQEIELQLTDRRPESDVSRINRLPEGGHLVVGPYAFDCIKIAEEAAKQTAGAFDIAFRSRLSNPETEASRPRSSAGRRANRRAFELDSSRNEVRALQAGLRIDLGGIGKGFALDIMAGLLKEWGFDCFLLHSGFSTAVLCGRPRGGRGWAISLAHPDKPGLTVRNLLLDRGAVSGSGLRRGPHIIDPRTGEPIRSKRAAWALAQTGAWADALSTAFMVMEPGRIREFVESRPEIGALIIPARSGGGKGSLKTAAFGRLKA